jgi:hypothetical protein
MSISSLGMVAYSCNPSYRDVEIGKITVLGQLAQKVNKISSQTII